MKEGVSIIICCYNSAEKLPETIQHVANQAFNEEILWEVIIVNNNSDDNTEEVAIYEWNKYPSKAHFRVIDQPIPGLNNARNKGINAARYNILIFCDDDNWLEQNYAQNTISIFRSDSKIGAVGGRGISTIDFPNWMGEYTSYYAIGPQGEASGDVTETSGCLYGAGLSVRKDAIESLYQNGFESILTGRTGKSLMSGEDTELTFAIRMIGWRLYYSDSLIFYHDLRKDRTKFRYFVRLLFYIGYSWMALQPYHTKLSTMKNKYPAPNWKDALYLTSNLVKCFLVMTSSLLKLNFKNARNQIFKSIFVLGQLKFIKNNYGIYKNLSLFILNSNANIGNGLVDPDRGS